MRTTLSVVFVILGPQSFAAACLKLPSYLEVEHEKGLLRSMLAGGVVGFWNYPDGCPSGIDQFSRGRETSRDEGIHQRCEFGDRALRRGLQ
jgi:hypothetical protein